MAVHLFGLTIASTSEIEADMKAFALSETDKLVAAVKAKFPDIVAGVQKLIADAATQNSTGAEKLFSVAEDAIGLLPKALAELSDVKTFAVQLAQSIFSDSLHALEAEAEKVLASL